MRIDLWKKNKKRIKTKYTWYYGDPTRNRDIPVECFNFMCKKHSEYCHDECRYNKCRFKINRKKQVK